MDQNTSDRRSKRMNDFWFFFAVLSSVTLMAWFTLAFFKDTAALKNIFGEMQDVSWGILSVGLGVIAGYTAQNKLLHLRCSDATRKPGEWIVLAIFVWSQVMWALYQTNIMLSAFGIALYMPDHFYSFVGTVIGMFAGSFVWDFAVYRYTQKNGNGNGNNKDKKS